MAKSVRTPARPAEPLPTKQLGIRVSAQMNDQLAAIARREQNSISAVIRRLVNERLNGEGA